jgi:hypothetical protein
MVDPAIYGIENKVVAIGEFVGETARHNASDQRRPDLAGIMNDEIRYVPVDTCPGKLPVQGLDDIPALAHAPEQGFQVFGQAPLPWRDLLGQTQTFQLLQPPRAESLPETILVSAGTNSAVQPRFAEKIAVETGKAFLLDLRPQPGLDLPIGARTQVQGYDFCGPLPHPPAEVLPGDDQVFPTVVLAAEDDMTVRMAGVVVVNRDPIQLGPEIPLHLAHQPAGQSLQVLVLDRILGGDDETELMTVSIAAI